MLNSIKIPIYGEKPEGGYYFQIYFSNIFCGIICKLKNDSYLCSALREKHYLTVVLERGQSGRLRRS